MGLDVTVYINPRPATADELAAINGEKDREAALVAFDRLESAGALAGLHDYELVWVTRLRKTMMDGGGDSPIDRHELAGALGLSIPYINPDFPQRAADLDAPAYRATVADIDIHFTYSGYSRWREWLASIAGIAVPAAVPSDGRSSLNDWWSQCCDIEARGEVPSVRFWQLLHFSDCEGALGPSVCKRLADDFDAAVEFAERSWIEEWQIRSYRKWRRAFREAGDTGGWVSFH
jgi:hypothetical protein